MRRLRLSHRVPARFMLHMIVAPTDDEMRLRPNDLTADMETACFKALGHDDRLRTGMPDIGNRSSKQFPSVPPVGTIVVLDSSCRPVGFSKRFVSPVGTIIDTIRGIGHHQDWPVISEQMRNIRSIRRVSASQSV